MSFFNKKNDNDNQTYVMQPSDEKPLKFYDNSKLVQIIVVCAMAAILLVGAFAVGLRLYRSRYAIVETTVPELPPVVVVDTTAEPVEVAEDYQEIDDTNKRVVLEQYQPYLSVYPEMVGWMVIEGIGVNYPVVQSKNINDPHFYLDKGPDQQLSTSGSLFMDTRNSDTELDRHTIIYGHNMKDGTMFGSLDRYRNKYFRNQNLTMYYNTLYEEYEWEIINIFISNTEFYYIETYFPSDGAYLDLMNQCIDISLYENEMIIEPDDKILTLSTCTNEIEDGRLVVQARLVTNDNDVEKN